jgi:soluble lytic murein transglycosylase
MNRCRAALFVSFLVAGSLSAHAEDPLAPGLERSGNVIMMRPIGDSDAGAPSNSEHRAGTVRALSSSDRDLFVRAFAAADAGDWRGARGLADQSHDAIARKLITWRYLLDKNSGAAFLEIDAFLKSSPDWPLRDTLLARAEAAIPPEMSAPEVVAWFAGRQPVAPIGNIRLGEALLATGKTSEGRAYIRTGWQQGSFDPPQELAIVEKDGSYFTPDVDRVRLDNLLWRDDVDSAKREIARVDSETARIGEVRIALRNNPSRAQSLLAQIPGGASLQDPGLLFDRARAARHAGNDPEAFALLARVPAQEVAHAHPAWWWGELNVNARQALSLRDYTTAYALAAQSGLEAGDEFAEAQFLAGWIALRYLHQPQQALSHFQKLDAGVSRAISRARARYWEGRAEEALGDPAGAYQDYKLAAAAPQTFYGQIALTRIDPAPVLRLPDASVEPAPKAEFEGAEPGRAMMVLADLGEVELLRIFALHEMARHDDAPHARLLAEELSQWGFPEIAVRVAKTESYNGVLMLSYLHPLIAVPAYKGPGTAPEPALVLALVRQETEFDPNAVSGPGARGLMQLMPSAARRSANLAGIAYRPNDLLSDPQYNMQLGMVELADDLGQWGGSYILATAAYNAGRHNVEKWVAQNGDPRNRASDPIDWIEQIPFTETRNYVQRVIENTQIYRNRLAGHELSLRILADLYAPNTPNVAVLNYAASHASADQAGPRQTN